MAMTTAFLGIAFQSDVPEYSILTPSVGQRRGKGVAQSGAGIVADSVAELERQESINKARAVIRAIERARQL
jgi:anthranilate/para-aminobenzoate synthase component I